MRNFEGIVPGMEAKNVYFGVEKRTTPDEVRTIYFLRFQQPITAKRDTVLK